MEHIIYILLVLHSLALFLTYLKLKASIIYIDDCVVGFSSQQSSSVVRRAADDVIGDVTGSRDVSSDIIWRWSGPVCVVVEWLGHVSVDRSSPVCTGHRHTLCHCRHSTAQERYVVQSLVASRTAIVGVVVGVVAVVVSGIVVLERCWIRVVYIDVINVKKIIINVNKRVYSEKR